MRAWTGHSLHTFMSNSVGMPIINYHHLIRFWTVDHECMIVWFTIADKLLYIHTNFISRINKTPHYTLINYDARYFTPIVKRNKWPSFYRNLKKMSVIHCLCLCKGTSFGCNIIIYTSIASIQSHIDCSSH